MVISGETWLSPLTVQRLCNFHLRVDYCAIRDLVNLEIIMMLLIVDIFLLVGIVSVNGRETHNINEYEIKCSEKSLREVFFF